MLLSDSSRVAPEALRFRRTGMGLKVGLILPANGEADSSGHPEACGSQPLDLALIGNPTVLLRSFRDGKGTAHCHPVCRSTRCVSISSSGQCQRASATLTASHWSILCRLRSSQRRHRKSTVQEWRAQVIDRLRVHSECAARKVPTIGSRYCLPGSSP